MSPAGTMESRRTPPAEAEIAQQYRYQWQRIGFSYARRPCRVSQDNSSQVARWICTVRLRNGLNGSESVLETFANIKPDIVRISLRTTGAPKKGSNSPQGEWKADSGPRWF